jgi:hypothetical protein
MDLPDPRVGLCARCLHCRIVQTPRSSFYLCGRSFTDPDFPKYPRLPVLRCVGFEPSAAGGAGEQPETGI